MPLPKKTKKGPTKTKQAPLRQWIALGEDDPRMVLARKLVEELYVSKKIKRSKKRE